MLKESPNLCTQIEYLESENDGIMEQLVEEIKRRKAMHNLIEDMKGNIRVIIRMRPLLKPEKPTSIAHVSVISFPNLLASTGKTRDSG